MGKFSLNMPVPQIARLRFSLFQVILYRAKLEKKDNEEALKKILSQFDESKSVIVRRQVKELTYQGSESLLATAMSGPINVSELTEVLKTGNKTVFSFALKVSLSANQRDNRRPDPQYG